MVRVACMLLAACCCIMHVVGPVMAAPAATPQGCACVPWARPGVLKCLCSEPCRLLTPALTVLLYSKNSNRRPCSRKRLGSRQPLGVHAHVTIRLSQSLVVQLTHAGIEECLPFQWYSCCAAGMHHAYVISGRAEMTSLIISDALK